MRHRTHNHNHAQVHYPANRHLLSRVHAPPEAELIREGIHLAAMANRVWDEPLDWPTFDSTVPDGL